jgi:hypothetical protein
MSCRSTRFVYPVPGRAACARERERAAKMKAEMRRRFAEAASARQRNRVSSEISS